LSDKALRTDAEIDELLAKYSDTVFKIAYLRTQNKMDAEDIFQNVFISYMRSDVTFADEEHLKAWIIRVTVNACNNLWKSAWRRHRADFDEAADYELPADGEVYTAVASLPPKYRTVVHLHYYEDMKIEDIANVLRVSGNTVKSRLHRARKILKGKLEDDFYV
jgi:RNA polymerase sigma-70 factor (ECF subfamily)